MIRMLEELIGVLKHTSRVRVNQFCIKEDSCDVVILFHPFFSSRSGLRSYGKGHLSGRKSSDWRIGFDTHLPQRFLEAWFGVFRICESSFFMVPAVGHHTT